MGGGGSPGAALIGQCPGILTKNYTFHQYFGLHLKKNLKWGVKAKCACAESSSVLLVYDLSVFMSISIVEFVGHTLEDVSMIDQTRTNVPVVEKEVSPADSNVSFEELMARIRHIVLTNRLRVRN